MELKMLPNGVDGRRGNANADAELAVEARGVAKFSLDKLKARKGETLGKGTFGVVCAIKYYSNLVMKEIAIGTHEGKCTELAERELRIIPRLSHSGILKYHQVIRDNHYIYIIMDRYYGDLDKFIADHRRTQEPIPRELMFSILRQLADALAYLHNPHKVDANGNALPGIVHRDLKPANVLISKDGNRFVLADFGLCKDAMHDGITFAGTLLYMAPEVFIHRKTSPASDIWALGVIIYELATLRLPSFSRYCNPEDAKEFFVDGWEPDLSAIEDAFVKMVLERIFVLDPERRPTAEDLSGMISAAGA